MKFGTRFTGFSVATAALLAASWASAHVRLIDPLPRLDGEQGGNQLKIGPCGQNNNARTQTVTNFTGGETIGVTFGEYINHQSYYRIALDVDGDDSFPMRPEESVSPEGDDPATIHPLSDINDTSLDVYILQYYTQDEGSFMQEVEYSTEVTLPNIDCQNCTLQLIQFMYNDPEPYYFQCADITITATDDTTTTTSTTTGAGGTTTTDGSITTGGMPTSGTTGTGGTGGSGIVPPITTGVNSTTGATTGATGTSAGTVTTTGATGTTGGVTTTAPGVTGTTASVTATSSVTSTTGTTGAPSTQEDEGGCSCRTASASSRGNWLGALLALGLLGYRRRPRAHR